MSEDAKSEPIPLKREEIQLTTAIKRIPEGSMNPNLPRPNLPDFSDEQTYRLLVGIARDLRTDDPVYQEPLALIPAEFEVFRRSTAGRHFAGEIPRAEIGSEGNQLLIALSRAVLDIPTSQPEARLLVAKNAEGKAVGFINISTYPLMRDALQNPDNPYHYQRLLEILQNPEDRYWQTLANQQVLTKPTIEQLKELQTSILALPIVSPNEMYTNPRYRRQGIATSLAAEIYQGKAVVGTTIEPAIVILRRKALTQHTTILAPAVDIEGQPSVAAIALQILPLSIYEKQYQDLATAQSPQANRFAAFADINNVAKGVFRFNQPDSDKEVRQRDAEYGLKYGLLTQREIRLLGVSETGVSFQYPIISLPRSL